MLDDAHIALMPSRALVAELRELARNDPRIYEITTARPGTPDPAALVTLTNDAGEITFQMIDLPVPGAAGRLYVGQLPGRASKLAGELDSLVAFGIRHVFSLLPAIDLADPYRVPNYIKEALCRSLLLSRCHRLRGAAGRRAVRGGPECGASCAQRR